MRNRQLAVFVAVAVMSIESYGQGKAYWVDWAEVKNPCTVVQNPPGEYDSSVCVDLDPDKDGVSRYFVVFEDRTVMVVYKHEARKSAFCVSRSYKIVRIIGFRKGKPFCRTDGPYVILPLICRRSAGVLKFSPLFQ